METADIINLLGYVALAALALTMLVPLVIAMKNCRAKKRRQKFSARNASHSLS